MDPPFALRAYLAGASLTVAGASARLLAIPIMVAIKAAADHTEPLQPLGELLGREGR